LDARARAWVKNLYKLSDIKNTIAKNASLWPVSIAHIKISGRKILGTTGYLGTDLCVWLDLK
jgi:hypothetical protein